MLENRAHDFSRHVAGRQLPSDLDADSSQVKAGQVAPPVVAHCSDNRSSWFLADGFPYRTQHRRVQAFELLNGNRVRGFIRCLGRNIDAHFRILLSIHASASADCSWFDLVDSVDWLEELEHELVEAHAEHCCRLLELLGGE